MTRREKSNSGRPIDKVELTFKKFDTNKVYSFHSTTIWIINGFGGFRNETITFFSQYN